MVILRKSRSFFLPFSLRLCVSFVLFILTSLCIPHIFFVASFFVFYFLFSLYGWSCSLETGPGSCLERWNGNERRQVIKIRGAQAKYVVSAVQNVVYHDRPGRHAYGGERVHIAPLVWWTANDTCHISTSGGSCIGTTGVKVCTPQ